MRPIALVFNRPTGADGTGHVGWGFMLGDDTFLVGSVDNPPHTLHTSPDKMGFWAVRTRDPIGVARAHAYTEMKVIELDQGDSEEAVHVVAWHSHKPYKLFGCNCMDVSYDILRAFGLDNLPTPAHDWEPNHWFDHTQGRYDRIEGQSISLETDPKGQAPTSVPLPAVDGRFTDVHEAIEPTVPAWRREHTAEADDFDAAKRNAPSLPSTATHRRGLLGWIWGLLRHRS